MKESMQCEVCGAGIEDDTFGSRCPDCWDMSEQPEPTVEARLDFMTKALEQAVELAELQLHSSMDNEDVWVSNGKSIAFVRDTDTAELAQWLRERGN